MKKVQIILKKRNLKTKKIYEEIVEFDENIKELNLSDMNLVEIPKGLEQFKDVITLNLSNNQISKIENLDKNINLNALSLSNNKITKIENIHHLDKLEDFYLFNSNQSENIEETKQISLNINHLNLIL